MVALLMSTYHLSLDGVLDMTPGQTNALLSRVPHVVGAGMNPNFGKFPPPKATRQELLATAARAGLRTPKGF